MEGTWTLASGCLMLLVETEQDLGDESTRVQRRILAWQVLESGIQVPPGGYGGYARGGPFLLERQVTGP